MFFQWGGQPSIILQHVQMYTINNDLCRNRYRELPGSPVVTSNMICAGLLDVGGRDACQGDSGGPLYAGDIIVGVVSWGHRCANETYPGLSTSVTSYTSWVLANARGWFQVNHFNKSQPFYLFQYYMKYNIWQLYLVWGIGNEIKIIKIYQGSQFLH